MINIKRLNELVQDLEDQVQQFGTTSCTEDETKALNALAAKLNVAATAIAKKTGLVQPSQGAWRVSDDLRKQSQSTIAKLFQIGKLGNPAVFRRTVVLIFTGPSEPQLESSKDTTRRISTQRRCERLRKLSPDALVAWAVSFIPTTWSANSMSHAVFDSLLEDMEMNHVMAWPPAVIRNLEALQKHKELKDLTEFNQFLTKLLDPSRHNVGAGSRTSHNTNAASLAPGHENREMKHMFTDAPALNISRMPQPFKAAVQNSKNWKWERSQNSSTTSCWSTLFPKDESQDVGFTIWVGHNDGYQLNDLFGMKRIVSS